jgi:transcriptional regulator with XRE-family HTH domain
MSDTATTPATRRPVRAGDLLRDWRRRRRLSQLDLANLAEVSARHLSFVETGRSKPSRELILHLAHHLDVPLRDRNQLLLAGGYAPAHSEMPLEAEPMEPVRQALDQILTGHEPFPAAILNQRWDLISANSATMAIFGTMLTPELLEPPSNVIRASLHPDGLAPYITNFAEYSDHMLTRLHRSALLARDSSLMELYEEVSSYPNVATGPSRLVEESSFLFVPLRLRTEQGELAFFSTIATFGTALDVTLAELAIESFFPADAATAAVLQGTDTGWKSQDAA